jgi:hypothetical protein
MIDGFNLSNWPIVYFSNNNNCNILDDTKFEELKEYYLNLLIRCKRNKEKIVLIFNLNNLNESSPSIKYVMKFAQFSKSIYKFNKEYVTGVCLLSTNKYLKDLLNVYFTVAKPACLVKICRSKEKANKFFKEKLNLNININKIISDFGNDVELSTNEDEKDSNDDIDEYTEKTPDDINDIEPEFDKDKYSALL